jgi:outer membrane protein assembly factor BamE (lipoprotein component of BamABCDE complex)
MKRIAVLLGAAMLAGCAAGTPFKWETVRQLKAGMTQDEVAAAMGRPYSATTRGDETIWTWSYANGMTGSNRAASLVFVGGRLVQPAEIPSNYRD